MSSVLLALTVLALSCTLLFAIEPGWWGPVKDANQTVQDNRAAANIGQLKNMAKRAMITMDERGMGAGEAVHSLVDAWPAASSPENYSALAAGQLKAVGKVFYDRLAELNLKPQGQYPWTASNENYAAVNVGQLKNVFDFDLPQITPVISIDSGNHQLVATGQTASLPLVVKLTDQQQAPLKGWQLTYTADAGEVSDDQFSWSSSIKVSTDGQGLGTVYYRGHSSPYEASVVVSLADGEEKLRFNEVTDGISLQPASSLIKAGPSETRVVYIRAVHGDGLPAANTAIHLSGEGNEIDMTTNAEGWAHASVTLPPTFGTTATVSASTPGGQDAVISLTTFPDSEYHPPILELVEANSRFIKVQHKVWAETGFVNEEDGTPVYDYGGSSTTLYATVVEGGRKFESPVYADGGGYAYLGISTGSVAGTIHYVVTDPAGEASLEGSVAVDGLSMSIVGDRVFHLKQGQLMTEPLKVRILNGETGVANTPVSFSSSGTDSFVVTTDANGVAEANGEARWRASTVFGAQVSVNASWSGITTSFLLISDISPHLAITGGDQQTIVSGTQALAPLALKAVDGQSNPVAGTTVIFATSNGEVSIQGGNVGWAPSVEIATSNLGAAQVFYRSSVNGPQTVTATLPSGAQVVFSLTVASAHFAFAVTSTGQPLSPMSAAVSVRTDGSYYYNYYGYPVAYTITSDSGTGAYLVDLNDPNHTNLGISHVFNTDSNGTTSAGVILSSSLQTVHISASTPGVSPVELTRSTYNHPVFTFDASLAGPKLAPIAATVSLKSGGNPYFDYPVTYTITSDSGTGAYLVDLKDPNHTTLGTSHVFYTDTNHVFYTNNGNTSAGVVLSGSLQTVHISVSAPNATPVEFTRSTYGYSVLRIVQGEGQSAPPGESLAQALKVQMLDAYGNVMPFVSIKFAITEGTGTLSGGSSSSDSYVYETTDATGTAAVSLRVSNILGSPTVVSVTYPNSDYTIGTTFHAVASPNALAVVSNWNMIMANQSGELEARLTQNGNAQAGAAVDWTDGTASSTTTTDADGRVRHIFSKAEAGYYTVSAQAQNFDHAAAQFVLQVVPASVSIKDGDHQLMLPGHAAADPLVVEAGIAGAEVQFTASTGAVSLSGNEGTWHQSVTAVADGDAYAKVFYLAGTSLGTATVTAALTGLNDSVSVAFAESIDNPVLSRLSAASGSGEIGSVQPVFTRVVRASNSAPFPGVEVAYAITASIHTAESLIDESGNEAGLNHVFVTGADGIAKASVQLPGIVSESVAIAASVSTAGSVSFAWDTTQALPSPRIRIYPDDSIPGIEKRQAAPGNVLGLPLEVQYLDRDGHKVPNATVTFDIALGDGTLSSQTAVTNNNGVASVTFHVSGTAGTTSVINVNSSTLPDTIGTQFFALASQNTLGIVGGNHQIVATSAVAADRLAVFTLAKNTAIHFATSTGAVSVEGNTWQTSLDVKADDSGTAAVFYRAGSSAGTASVTASTGGSSVSFSVIVGTASLASAVSVSDGNMLVAGVGQWLSTPLAVQLVTTGGTALSLAQVPVTFTIDAGDGMLALNAGDLAHASSTIVAGTDAGGLAWASVKLGDAAGVARVSATLQLGGGYSVSVPFEVHASAHLALPSEGLVAWFRPDIGVTLSGGAVSTWRSSTGTLTAVADSVGPAVEQDAASRRKYMVFGGSQRLRLVYDTSTAQPADDFTIVSLASPGPASSAIRTEPGSPSSSDAGLNGQHYLFGGSIANEYASSTLGYSLGTTSTSGTALSGGLFQFIDASNVSGIGGNLSITSVPASTAAVHSLGLKSKIPSLRWQGSSAFTGTTAIAQTAVKAPDYIGGPGFATLSNAFQGKVGDIILYSRALTAAETQQVEDAVYASHPEVPAPASAINHVPDWWAHAFSGPGANGDDVTASYQAFLHRTYPVTPGDTDGDGVSDADEIQDQTDLADPASYSRQRLLGFVLYTPLR